MLPGWVTSNEESVKQEAADYIDMSPSEKATIVAMLCRDAVMIASPMPIVFSRIETGYPTRPRRF
jgi:hypothetical protein